MDVGRWETLLDALSEAPSHHRMRRSLAAMTLAGGLTALAGGGEAEAKKKCRKKKKKCPKPPFCTGKNSCLTSETFFCNNGGTEECLCMIAAETGSPFCGLNFFLLVDNCTQCSADRTCIFAAPNCDEPNLPLGCALPCSNPL